MSPNKIVDFQVFFHKSVKIICDKMQKRAEAVLLYFGIPLLGFILDFITKQMVISNLCMEGKTVGVLPFFDLVCVLNTGVSFGFMAGINNGRSLLIVITVVILCVVYCMMYKEQNRVAKYCYSVIISGAFGNIIDRIIHGGVVDFLDFYHKTHHYPAFNVADSLIFTGVCGIIISQILEKKTKN